MKKIILTPLLIFIFFGLILGFALRGLPGNPTQYTINNDEWKDGGPFELSPDRGRFALTLSIVENKSVTFSLPIARFATPDLGYKNGHFVSLFAPGVSFLIAPGYIVGKFFGASQVGTFAIISLFALLNAYLIRRIALLLGASSTASTLGAFVFLFATPAFTYGVTLYQHHISTALLLMCVLILLTMKQVKSLIHIWFLAALSLSVDYPNLFLMLPIGIFGILKLFEIKKNPKLVEVGFKIKGLFTFMSIITPFFFFFWFNYLSYGSPFQLAGTVAAVKAIDATGKPTSSQIEKISIDRVAAELDEDRSAIHFFETRFLLNGLYTHSISPDRGVLSYTPIVLFALAGIVFLYRTNSYAFQLLIGVMGINILLYSMWSDPWGGWAFGSRYLIPSYAIAGILIALFLSYYKKKLLILAIFFVILVYSLSVNTLGAITSSRNPPQIEVLSLEKITGREQKYTPARNLQFLLENGSKSFIYNTIGKHIMSAKMYYLFLTFTILGAAAVFIILLNSEKTYDKV